MKKLSLIALAAAAAFLASCEKPQSEAERNAQIEREVQQRLAAERQADEQQHLANLQSDLDAREQTLSEKEAAAARAAASTPRPVAQNANSPRSTPARASADTRAPKTYDTFYRKLEPYGAWRETNDYGYVWQPQQAQRSRDWRPYADGRWAYTDSGWTWISEEPFGWATYHYGRWIQLRNVGWVWVPGDEWAPAWVSWRTSDEYVGWAPLPPEAQFDRRRGIQKWADSYYDIDIDEYVFVPTVAIGSPRLVREVVPVEQNVAIVNQTVNVTNITYNNVTIINEGPNYEEIRRRSRRPVERLRLDRQLNIESDSPQAVVRGDVLTVNAPVFAAQAVERPRVVGDPIRQVEPARASAANGDRPEARRAREKMKAEATAPSDAPPKRYQKPKMVDAAPATDASPAAVPATTPAASPTASPVMTATPTPRPSVAATATPVPTMAATVTPSPISTPAATASPRASASPRATAAATATPIQTPVPTPTPSLTPLPSATVTPLPVFSPRPRPSPRVSPVVSPTPAAVEPLAGNSTPAGVPPKRGRGNGNRGRNAPPAAQPAASTADESADAPGNTDDFSLGNDPQNGRDASGRAGAGKRSNLNRKPGRPALAAPVVPTATTPPPPAVTPTTSPLAPAARPFTTPASTTTPTATPTPTPLAAAPNSAVAPATADQAAQAATRNNPAAARRQGATGRGANRRLRPAPPTEDGDAESAETPEPAAEEP